MKKYFLNKSLLIVFVLACFCSCKQTNRIVDENKIEQSIRDTYGTYVNAMQNVDAVTALNLYADTDELIYSRDGEIIKGKDALSKSFKEGFSTIEKISRIHIYDRNIAILSKESAVQTLAYHYMALVGTADTIASKGTATYVFKKIDDDWKVMQAAVAHFPFDEESEEFKELSFAK